MMDRYTIERDDKIFARLTMGGRVLVEFMMIGISSINEVISELKRMSGGVRGLAKLYIRNHSQGWSIDRGLMVYSSEGSLRNRISGYGELPLGFEGISPVRERGMSGTH